jgi:RNA polymerase sigma factor (sigma-70 family)
MAKGVDFENLVDCHYKPLFQFAISLTRDEADACDLTQETFCIWAAKGHQLRDESKVKTWLFTTLHREFLSARKKQIRFPHVDLEDATAELPVVLPAAFNQLDVAQVLAVLAHLNEVYRAPVALFYLQGYSYIEIAEILEVPIGTVKSRLARGIARLHQLLTGGTATGSASPQPDL